MIFVIGSVPSDANARSHKLSGNCGICHGPFVFFTGCADGWLPPTLKVRCPHCEATAHPTLVVSRHQESAVPLREMAIA